MSFLVEISRTTQNLPFSAYAPDAASIQGEMSRLAVDRGFIVFYNEKDPFTEWLGNFYPIEVEYEGLTFLNSEAAFQAQKFIQHPEMMAQFTHVSGEEAFYLARKLSHFVRADWKEVNVQVMKEVLEAKLSKNPQIGAWLDATHPALLIEHTPVKGRDAFWADDHDGTGQNMLGALWMQVRSERQKEPLEAIDPSHTGEQNYLQFLQEEK